MKFLVRPKWALIGPKQAQDDLFQGSHSSGKQGKQGKQGKTNPSQGNQGKISIFAKFQGNCTHVREIFCVDLLFLFLLCLVYTIFQNFRLRQRDLLINDV